MSKGSRHKRSSRRLPSGQELRSDVVGTGLDCVIPEYDLHAVTVLIVIQSAKLTLGSAWRCINAQGNVTAAVSVGVIFASAVMIPGRVIIYRVYFASSYSAGPCVYPLDQASSAECMLLLLSLTRYPSSAFMGADGTFFHGACASGTSRVLSVASFHWLKMDAPIPAPDACEVLSMKKFLNGQGIAPIEIDCQLCQVYGPNIMSKQMVRCSTRSNKFFVDNAVIVKEGDQQCFQLGFLRTAFFGRGEVGEHHDIESRFDSGSNW
ncbi:hypothetical protein ANN_00904 [Periplaneta americana]|uniref:Uncharacterized protein n=1 Tax=Periplaneta americana TaxID=6978 RepID=A0ABQ8TS73_PERAM|nr:hypothetical protein ANN_00904 [Periplaneta americana]